MAFVLPFIPIIGGVLGGASSIIGGMQANAAYQQEAKAYEMNSRSAKIAADQTENERRRDLLGTLSAVRAIRTSRGLDVSSPTGEALTAGLTDTAERGIATDRLNNLTQAASYSAQAGISRTRGRGALISGFLQGGSSLLGAGGDLYSLGQNRKWWT